VAVHGCSPAFFGISIMSYQLEFEAWVPFPLPRVFAFFSNPENLPRIMPASTQTRIEELHRVPPPLSQDSAAYPHAAGVGTVIVTSFRLFPFLPFRAQWIARIDEFQGNHYFADVKQADVKQIVQQKGPFERWHHRHEFQAETRNSIDGTLVRDTIEYELGFGPLGALANTIFIESQVRHTFAKRQRILPQLLSAS
jgi:ligand-binding SRPBCC domain-containing protein